MPDRLLVGQEHAAGVDVEIEVPVLVGQVDDQLHARDAGIGAEDVVAAEGRLDRGKQASTLTALADVDPEPLRAVAERAGKLVRGASSRSATATRTPSAASAAADRPADAPAAAGDDGALV